MQLLDIQSFSYEDRRGLLPSLLAAFSECGGWILDRKTLSPTVIEFRIEIQLRSVLDLYGSLVSAGLELTRSGHLALTEMCTCCRNLSAHPDPGQVLTIRLEISFLDDLTLHSLLMTGGPVA
jgi:hypothetical protein